MVIFTDQKSAILEHRNETLPTVIISLYIETTMVYNMLADVQWWIMENKDPEKDLGHNKKLYSVWNEKTNFMKTAADKNYFNSNYFLWLDIGAVRHEAHKNMTLVRRLPLEDGVLLLSLGMCLLVPTNPLNWFGLQDFFIGNIPNQTYQRFNMDDREWKKQYF